MNDSINIALLNDRVINQLKFTAKKYFLYSSTKILPEYNTSLNDFKEQ